MRSGELMAGLGSAAGCCAQGGMLVELAQAAPFRVADASCQVCAYGASFPTPTQAYEAVRGGGLPKRIPTCPSVPLEPFCPLSVADAVASLSVHKALRGVVDEAYMSDHFPEIFSSALGGSKRKSLLANVAEFRKCFDRYVAVGEYCGFLEHGTFEEVVVLWPPPRDFWLAFLSHVGLNKDVCGSVQVYDRCVTTFRRAMVEAKLEVGQGAVACSVSLVRSV